MLELIRISVYQSFQHFIIIIKWKVSQGEKYALPKGIHTVELVDKALHL